MISPNWSRELLQRLLQIWLKGGILIAVLLLLFGEIRGALIVASVIPIAMLFAFIGMDQLGLAANLMSLGAIDFGMVAPASVVIGGLITATLLTLLVLPTIYEWLERGKTVPALEEEF